jgi:hypothetical protein
MGKQWAKSSNGPDWIDLRAMMVAIGQLHTATVELIVSPLGIGSTGSVTVQLVAHFDKLPGSSLPETVITKAEWPGKKSQELTELAYNLLWQLDYEISKVYEQSGLWAE